MPQTMAIVVAIACVIGAILILRRPQWAIVVLMVMYPLEQLLQSYFPVLRATPWILNVVVGVLAGLAIASRLFQRESVMAGFLNGVTALVLVMYGHVWLSLLWSPSEQEARALLISGIPYMLLFFGCAPLLLHDLRQFRPMVVGIMIVGTVITLLIFLNPSSMYYRGRLVLDLGSYGLGASNPLALATLGGMSALIAALIKLERPSRLFDVIRAIAFFMGLGLAIGSGSRGQVISAAVAGLVFYPVARRMARPGQFLLVAGGLFMLVVGTILVFQVFVTDVNRARWNASDLVGASEGRIEMATNLLDAWASEPAAWFLGLGVNAYTSVCPGTVRYVHNFVVEVLCELGLVGATMLAVVCLYSYRYGSWLWRRYRDDPSLRSVAAILGAMWLYTTLQGLKQGSFCLNPPMLVWWLVMATIAVREQQMAALEPMPEPEPEPEPEEERGEGAYTLSRA